jgi:hypothetical protein
MAEEFGLYDSPYPRSGSVLESPAEPVSRTRSVGGNG